MPDHRLAIELVEKEVTDALSRALVPADGHGFRVLEGFEATYERPIGDFNTTEEGPYEATVIAVPWQWTGEHLGEVLGLPPTGRRLTVRGVTLVQDRPEREKEPLEMHRYVDWGAFIEEIGVVVYRRPVVDVRDRFGPGFRDVEQFRELFAEDREKG